MSEAEFRRLVDVRQAHGRQLHLVADDDECRRLAARFGLMSIGRLEAVVSLERRGSTVDVRGRLLADIVQSCAVSGEDLPVAVDEPISFRFVPARAHDRPDEVIELEAEELDEIEYDGTQFDLGEAVAQSLALAIDPFAAGPDAEEARRRAGITDETGSGPFATLAKLKRG